MDNEKKPWEMPTPPENIQRIIDKVDNYQDLTDNESKALDDWEDKQGGFGGFMDRIDTNNNRGMRE